MHQSDVPEVTATGMKKKSMVTVDIMSTIMISPGN
jgi:hypothetical protein